MPFTPIRSKTPGLMQNLYSQSYDIKNERPKRQYKALIANDDNFQLMMISKILQLTTLPVKFRVEEAENG